MSVVLNRPKGLKKVSREQPDPDAPWRRWQDWANLLVGVWLWACSGVFDTFGTTSGSEAALTTVIAGTVICGASLWALAEPQIREIEGIIAVTAVWLILTPMMFDFVGTDPVPALNSWATAVISLTLAVWAMMDHAVGRLSRQ